MAQLYRRILGIQNHFVILTIGLALLAGPVHADDVGLPQLETIAADLASPTASVRQEAIDRLASLGPEWAAAVRARAPAHRLRDVPEITVARAFASFRHATGSRRADDRVDLVAGVPVRLALDRERVTLSVAERILLVRAMALAGGDEAAAALVAIAEVDAMPFRMELRSLVETMGPRMLQSLWAARASRAPWLREWSVWGFRTVGMESPGTAVQRERGEEIALVLRTYGLLRDMRAMSVIVSLCNDSREQVRTAARAAIAAYGVNARWQLRTAYRLAVGEDAPADWDHQQLAASLFARFDRERDEGARAELDRARTAMQSGAHQDLAPTLAAVLARAPALRDETLRAGFATLADSASDSTTALALARRAVRTTPGKPQPRDAARVERLRAEQWLARGIVDVEGYARAAALDPSDELSASRLDAFTDHKPTGWLIGCAAALVIAALALARRKTKGAPAEAAPLEQPS